MRELRDLILVFPSSPSLRLPPSPLPLAPAAASCFSSTLSLAASIFSRGALAPLSPGRSSFSCRPPRPVQPWNSTVATHTRLVETEKEGERGSGCTEAIYFWHPFLLRLVHSFIICIRFCCRVPVGSVFVGPLGAHVSIFLAARTTSPRCPRLGLKIDG